ncbi:MAG: hypothetical protein J5671_08970 [Bacteroidaceae bacterium]|nr:hypothetical protein [Bacteroidaceae bacterium]
MSDGNFNRALLPHTPYQSGLKAGKAMGAMHAIEAFKEYLAKYHPDLNETSFLEQLENFRQLLSRRMK